MLIAFGPEAVRRHLTFERCIPVVRDAMIDLSLGRTRQILRQILPVDQHGVFGVMQGVLGPAKPFGAKVLSVFPENVVRGGQSHQGLVLLFDRESGAPTHVVDAGELTAIRTAAASAVATDALARPEARRLAILGTGEQARGHAAAICKVRPIETITLWGRSQAKAEALAHELRASLGCDVLVVATPSAAAASGDVICTVTSAKEPFLSADDIPAGAHLNVVGSSHLGPREVDDALVARARMFADHAESVLSQGAEFRSAIEAGLITEAHLLGEIGHVLAGVRPGRVTADEVTMYKSLGNIVQDLACAALLSGEPQGSARPADHRPESEAIGGWLSQSA